MAVCRINEKSSEIKCPLKAWEGDLEGFCILHSRQADKDQEGRFTAAVQKKLDQEDYNFRGVFFPGDIRIFFGHKFKKDADFIEATFSGLAAFFRATFSGNADFVGATFSGNADFVGATFSGNADFSGATFSGVADFLWATFSGAADFSSASFSGETTFSGATFSGEAYFSRANFSGKANFSRATFSGETFFRGTDFQGPASFPGTMIKNQLLLDAINPPREEKARKTFQADFRGLRFAEAGRLHFRDLSLAHATLTGADLNPCRFHNVDWHPFRGRQALYDEVWLYKEGNPGKEEYARVEESYRYLKLNYEGAGDFKKVGDFHYGEMEMHRRGSPWRQWLPSWYNFYRALSGYGERPLRAFIWLLLLIPAWAGLVWGLGIDRAGSQNPITYWDTLLFIFEKATLQRPEWPKGITWLGKFLGSLSVLLLPGQAALFILALRNRLGRRR